MLMDIPLLWTSICERGLVEVLASAIIPSGYFGLIVGNSWSGPLLGRGAATRFGLGGAGICSNLPPHSANNRRANSMGVRPIL